MKRYATPGVGQRYSHFPFRNYPDRFLLLRCAEQRVSSQPVLPENSASTPNELVSRCKDGEYFSIYLPHSAHRGFSHSSHRRPPRAMWSM